MSSPTRTEWPSHATILVRCVPPLGVSHAQDLIQGIWNWNSTSENPSDSADSLSWTIRNKYYSAQIGFKILSEVTESTSEDEPAIIVIAPRDKVPAANVKDALQKFSSRAEEFDVALLVTVGNQLAEENDEIDCDSWDDLALENGFEWVNTSNGLQEAAPAFSTDKKEADNEQIGLARVIAALQAHMWQNMVPVEVPSNSAPNSAGRALDADTMQNLDDLSLDEFDEFNTFSELGAPPLPRPRPFVPIDLNFPDEFLPSIKKPNFNSFDDDFSPFQSAATSAAEPDLSPPACSPAKDVAVHLYRQPEFAFPDEFDRMEEFDAEEFDALAERMLKLARTASPSVEESEAERQERRDFAERAMIKLIASE